MTKRFKFTTALLKSLPPHDRQSKSTETEYSDTEITGFKCLSGKSGLKRFLLRYTFNRRKTSISIDRFPDFEGQLEAVRNTVVSMNETTKVELSKYQQVKKRKEILEEDEKSNTPIRVEPFNVYDINRNYHKVAVKFYDSMLIAPIGQSLGAIGELLDMPNARSHRLI